MGIPNSLLTFAFLFFVGCLIFMPVFVWQIRNQSKQTNKLLKQLVNLASKNGAIEIK